MSGFKNIFKKKLLKAILLVTLLEERNKCYAKQTAALATYNLIKKVFALKGNASLIILHLYN